MKCNRPESYEIPVVSALIGRRAELVAMTRVLLQSRKDNLIFIGEPGVGKTVGRGGLAAP